MPLKQSLTIFEISYEIFEIVSQKCFEIVYKALFTHRDIFLSCTHNFKNISLFVNINGWNHLTNLRR